MKNKSDYVTCFNCDNVFPLYPDEENAMVFCSHCGVLIGFGKEQNLFRHTHYVQVRKERKRLDYLPLIGIVEYVNYSDFLLSVGQGNDFAIRLFKRIAKNIISRLELSNLTAMANYARSLYVQVI